MGKAHVLNVQLVGLSKVVSQKRGIFTINPVVLIHDLKKTDSVIIPAIHRDPKAFRVTIKKITGLSLIEYRTKYTNKVSVQ